MEDILSLLFDYTATCCFKLLLQIVGPRQVIYCKNSYPLTHLLNLLFISRFVFFAEYS